MANYINPVFLANKGGIPRIESTGVSVGTDSVVFNFRSDLHLSRNYSGLVLVRLAQAIPEGTTTTLPVVFNSSGSSQPLTGFNAVNITVADLAGAGVYMAYYEGASGTLQLLAS